MTTNTAIVLMHVIAKMPLYDWRWAITGFQAKAKTVRMPTKSAASTAQIPKRKERKLAFSSKSLVENDEPFSCGRNR